jgi:hypothetical protein
MVGLCLGVVSFELIGVLKKCMDSFLVLDGWMKEDKGNSAMNSCLQMPFQFGIGSGSRHLSFEMIRLGLR